VRQLIPATMLVIAAIANPGPALAEGDAGSGWGRITEVYVDAAGTLLRVQFSGKIVNPGGCEGADFYVRELDDSVASDRFLRVVLAAHLADRRVKFWIDGCSKAQWWGKTRPQIYDIYVAD
jgi:hypothetical protein